MDRITYHDISHSIGQIVIFLFGISAFLIYKMIGSFTMNYLIILGICIIGIPTTYRVGRILKNALFGDGNDRLGFFDLVVTKFVLMFLLGGLSLYIVFYKGLYGLYELKADFSWFLLFFRLLIIFVGSKMVFALDKLQRGYNMIEQGNYSVESKKHIRDEHSEF